MSALSVRIVQPAAGDAGDAAAGASDSAAAADVQALPFFSGNPRVERVSGVVHLYRPTLSDGAAAGSPGVGASAAASALPATDTMCVLGVPGSLAVSDFCQFCGAMLPRISDMRLVRDEDARGDDVFRYAVLLRFDTPAAAVEFYRFYHGRAFNSLEPDVCHVVFVKDVEYTAGSAPPPAGQTELPSCPVCLERLDTHISGIVTTVCNHTFHSACLSKWADSSCPVCRYSQEQPDEAECQVCGSTDNLWICIICGYVGCGRYASGHAVSHWRETDHCYSLELDTQRVWDYLGDGYVHRLIASKTHGHLVELSPPRSQPRRRQTDGGDDDGACEGASCGGAAGGAGADGDEMEEAMLSSKLDAVALEYNQLLTSQLESQRQYFEGLIAAARMDADRSRLDADSARAASTAAEARASSAEARSATLTAENKELDKTRRATERKLEDTQSKLARATEEKDFLKQLSDNLLSNQKDLQERIRVLEAASRETSGSQDAQIKDLEEQVRDLMVFIEAQRAVESAGSGELRDGAVVSVKSPGVPATPESPSVALHNRLAAKAGDRRRK